MNTSLNWIKAMVPGLECTDQEFRDAMTLSGTKVECFNAFDKNLDKIVVGQILSVESADGIQLHAVQTAVSHSLRQHTKEIAHTHRRLQNISGLKSHTVHRFIDGLNDRRAGVMGVEGRASGGSIFLRGQQFF